MSRADRSQPGQKKQEKNEETLRSCLHSLFFVFRCGFRYSETQNHIAQGDLK